MQKVTSYLPILLLPVLLCIFTSCSTSQISVNKKELKNISTIAIMKFDAEEGIDKKIPKDCEESFKGHFINIHKHVVERDKLNSIVKEIEKSQTGLYKDPIEIGKLSGAQALLFGEVTEYNSDVRRVKYLEYNKKTKQNVEKEKDKKFFTFQVNIRLVSTTSGDIIMTLKNQYPENSYEITDSMTLARYKEGILNQMGKDLKDALKEKK